MPGLSPPFAQRPFSDDDEVGRVAQCDLCDRVGFDDLQAANGQSNLQNNARTNNFTFYWTLKGRRLSPSHEVIPEKLSIENVTYSFCMESLDHPLCLLFLSCHSGSKLPTALGD
jgi:hypothetical protein